jgi:hypothetical protein
MLIANPCLGGHWVPTAFTAQTAASTALESLPLTSSKTMLGTLSPISNTGWKVIIEGYIARNVAMREQVM